MLGAEYLGHDPIICRHDGTAAGHGFQDWIGSTLKYGTTEKNIDVSVEFRHQVTRHKTPGLVGDMSRERQVRAAQYVQRGFKNCALAFKIMAKRYAPFTVTDPCDAQRWRTGRCHCVARSKLFRVYTVRHSMGYIGKMRSFTVMLVKARGRCSNAIGQIERITESFKVTFLSVNVITDKDDERTALRPHQLSPSGIVQAVEKRQKVEPPKEYGDVTVGQDRDRLFGKSKPILTGNYAYFIGWSRNPLDILCNVVECPIINIVE